MGSRIKFYQTIPEAGIKGTYNTPKEFDLLPKNLKGQSVLDIGCNTGAFLIEAKKRGANRACGIEPNDYWRWLAIGINKKLGLDIEYRKKLGKEKYDVVLLLSVLHLIENPQELLDNAWKLMNKLLIVEINDRLQKKPIKLPKEATFYGKNKDNRSVYYIPKDDSR